MCLPTSLNYLIIRYLIILVILKTMSTKYKFRNQDKLYFVTFTTVGWVDVFTRTLYKDLLIDSLKYCQLNKGLELYAYCIMTNHIHLIMGRNGSYQMQEILRDFKKFTCVKIIKEIRDHQMESRKDWMLNVFSEKGKKNSNNKNFQFWQQNNHPIELSDNHMMDQKLEYIHNNPVKAGIVLSSEEYLYSSAKNYAGMPETLIDVKFIE